MQITASRSDRDLVLDFFFQRLEGDPPMPNHPVFAISDEAFLSARTDLIRDGMLVERTTDGTTGCFLTPAGRFARINM